MPGIPLVARETSSYGRSAEHMFPEDERGGCAAEEELAAEESLSVYCKPVELYNILQRRASRNPLFLQRCLSYKIQAKRKRGIQLTVSLSLDANGGVQGVFPLYILLARRVSEVGAAEHSAVYRFNRASILTSTGVEGGDNPQASFLLPEFHRLASEAKSRSLVLLVVSFAGAQSSSNGIDLTRGLLENIGGSCLVGQIPIESLCLMWEKSPNFSLGQRVDLTFPVNINACFLKLSCFKDEKCVLIQFPHDSGSANMLSLVQINVSAEEVGGRENSPYQLYTCSNISPSLSHIIRLRAGNVIFNYRYYNNKMQKTEVTEDFSCPFCLVKCASFKGLRYHLCSSHDLFNFEFWVTEEFQAVNISVRTDSWRSETVADGVDPKQQTFSFCSKKRRRKCFRKHAQNVKHASTHIFQSNLRLGICELLDKTGEEASPDADNGQSVSGNNLQLPAMLSFAKTRKLLIERPDIRNRTLLHTRQFFHSHRAQPMEIEQVLSDRDSEDEVDDDVADFEDRRMLDDFVDVTKYEKQMMHWWNSFVRKQRVLADGHIPWACEAFSRLHGPDLVQTPALIWCWRLFMIKLWNHGLLDARTMNTCNIVLKRFQNEERE